MMPPGSHIATMKLNRISLMAVIFNGWMFIQTHGAPQVTIFDISDWDSTPAMKQKVQEELRQHYWTEAKESHDKVKPKIDFANKGLTVDYSSREDNVVCITNYKRNQLHYLLRDGQSERFFKRTISPNEEHRIPFEAGHWLMTWIKSSWCYLRL
jgi:hypothetical protein